MLNFGFKYLNNCQMIKLIKYAIIIHIYLTLFNNFL